MSKNSIRKKDLKQLALIIVALIAMHIFSSIWHFRIDLTAEKRHTLSSVTRSFLKKNDKEILVRIYLEGDLNVGFQRLARAAREMLDEFKLASGGLLRYEFINPSEYSGITEELKEWGFSPIPVFEAEADGRQTRSNVFPFALFRIDEYELLINLLENLPGKSGVENLNISIESLEYKFTDVIRRLLSDEIPSIAFLEGHGELDEMEVYDITKALSHYYQVDRGVLMPDLPFILDNYEALIIAKPLEPFSQSDKFIIDQYIMRGGKVLWLIDAVNVTLDSLRKVSHTVGLATDLNLSDQLFRYGARINHDLIQDVQAALIPINTAAPGEQARIVPAPWLFNPLLGNNANHSVSRNISPVRGEFVSSIDTVGRIEGVRRDILLQSSRFSRKLSVPVYISLALVNEEPLREEFVNSYVPVAVSMEGTFPSLFSNRPLPLDVHIKQQEIKHQSEPNRMIVVADGDIIKNEVRLPHGGSPQILPLGFDEMSNQTFGNKQFVLNAVNYLVDDEGWMSLRTRNYELRLLDREKLSSQLFFWKTLNVLSPLIILLIIGIAFPLWRKLKYGRRTK